MAIKSNQRSLICLIIANLALNFHLIKSSSEFEDDELMAPICGSAKCSCHRSTKTVSCRGLVFEYLPNFPAWTEHLILSGNHLTLLKDNSFEGLSQLKRLDVSSSGLEYVESDTFNGLDSLTFLDLSHNRLYYWPSETFRPLTKLRILNLSGNAFDDLTIFTKLLSSSPTQLEELILSENQFVRKSSDFVKLPLIRRFAISGAKFRSVSARSLTLRSIDHNQLDLSVRIDALARAERLDLFNCDSKLESNFLDSIRNVTDLNIGSNSIDDPSVFRKFETFPFLETLNVSGIKSNTSIKAWNVFPPRLESLDVSNLGLDEIASNSTPIKLKTLFASNNRLINFHLWRSASELRHLKLDGNRLINFPSIELGVTFEFLEHLDLSDNLITSIDSSSLNSFPNLNRLLLRRNRIASIHAFAFSTCSRTLKILDISQNSLETTSNFRFESLTSLNLSSNRLIELGDSLSSPHVEVLDVSYNEDLMSERRLFNCNRKEIDSAHASKSICSPASSWIDALAALPRLKRLDARGVGLDVIPTSPIAAVLSRVQHLDLGENSISSEQWESLVSAASASTCLRTLRLHRNRLTALRNLTIFKAECIETLDLSENPFDCDCRLAPVYNILKSLPDSEKAVYNESVYYCFSPSNYFRYPLYEFAYNLQPCSYFESTQSIASTNGLRIILAIFLGLVLLVLTAVCCRVCMGNAAKYGFHIRQRMYKPLRVIISGSENDLASPTML